jgi:hypothetical protein
MGKVGRVVGSVLLGVVGVGAIYANLNLSDILDISFRKIPVEAAVPPTEEESDQKIVMRPSATPDQYEKVQEILRRHSSEVASKGLQGLIDDPSKYVKEDSPDLDLRLQMYRKSASNNNELWVLFNDDLENEPLQDFAVRGLDLLETSGYVPMGYEPEPILDPSSKRLMQLRVDFETNLDVVLQDTDHEDIKVRQTAHRAYRRIAEILKIEGKRISTKDSSLQPITFSSLLDKEFNDPNIRERYGKAFAGLDNAYSGMEAMGSWLYLED